VDKSDVANLVDPPDGLKDQILNAGILAGVGFFSTLASVQATGIIKDPVTAVVAAGISAGLEFFLSLAIQRGLKKGE